MSDRTYEEYLRVSAHFSSLASTPRTIESIAEITALLDVPPEAQHLANDIFATFVTRIDDEIEDTVGFPASPLDVLRGLPADIACHPRLETYVVDDADPRVALRGRQGIRAAKVIATGRLLGLYRGDAMFHSDFVEWKLTPPTHDTNPIEHERAVDAYTASTTWSVGEWAAKHGLGGLSPFREDTEVMICGTFHGNMTALVNDPCIDPLHSPIPTTLEANACLCGFAVGAWPVLALFNYTRLLEGVDVRYTYGRDYWEYMKEHSMRLDSVRRFYTM